jgi:hypothetical protein
MRGLPRDISGELTFSIHSPTNQPDSTANTMKQIQTLLLYAIAYVGEMVELQIAIDSLDAHLQQRAYLEMESR